MSKGTMVGHFKVGDQVSFPSEFIKISPHVDKDGKEHVTKQTSPGTETGIILKLHKSGRKGVAEIKPSHGGAKVSRKLQGVEKA
jgi:hypothetical protein